MIPEELRLEIEEELLEFVAEIALTWLDCSVGSCHADAIICHKGHYIEVIVHPFGVGMTEAQMEWAEHKSMAGAKIFELEWVTARNKYVRLGIEKMLLYMDSIERVPFGYPKFKC